MQGHKGNQLWDISVMQGHSKGMLMGPIQFFDNGMDKDSLASVRKIEAAGYDVQFAPTSGPSALWVEDYEVVGGTDIRNVSEQLVMKRTEKA